MALEGGRRQISGSSTFGFKHVFFVKNNSTPPSWESASMSFTTDQVSRQLRVLKAGKSAGPDDVSLRVLKACTDQFGCVHQWVFKDELQPPPLLFWALLT